DLELMMGVDATGHPICDKPVLAQEGSACGDEQAAFGITKEGRLDCKMVRNYCGGNIALSLAMDTSGSMNSNAGGGSRIQGAKAASTEFVDFMRGDDNFGVVEFNTGSNVITKPIKDKTSL